MSELKLDEFKAWTATKQRVLREYLKQYSTILTRQHGLEHVYVDAFAGAGLLRTAVTGELVEGTPLIALGIAPPFAEYHFIEDNQARAQRLRQLCTRYPQAQVHVGDCNEILVDRILPRCKYSDRRRAFWLLDAYGMHYGWRVIEAAGRERSIELFLNWSIMDINRNIALTDTSKLSPEAKARMRDVWGDDNWTGQFYAKQLSLLAGHPDRDQKRSYRTFIEAYCKRLKEVAGFAFVPKPVLIVGGRNQPLYYLVFASNNETGARIAGHLLRREERRARSDAAPTGTVSSGS